ncbi:MAG: hypothetical protein WBQ23_01095 [Bacteroidota bacterium]
MTSARDHRSRTTEHRIFLLTLTILLSSLLLPIHPGLAAQQIISPDAMSCGMQESSSNQFSKSIDSHGGAHLPFRGAIRGRVIFVQTLNDCNADANWPVGSMPNWANSYVDRLKRYFGEMSYGAMDLQLDLHPDLMITRGTEDNYVYWLQNFGSAIKEIIDSLDTDIDFAVYDQWDSEGKSYRLDPGPDGQVDLLIFVFRSIANASFLPFTGVSDLGFTGYQFLDDTLNRWAYGGSGGFNDASSSGVTVCRAPGYRIVIDPDFAFQVTIHEFGHKLFGEGHPAELFGGLGIMANGGNGYAMNSFERQLAGYTTFLETTPGVDTTVTLRDYVTTGEALLIPVPEAIRSYYSLEYRSRSSEWDTAPVDGLYAYRIYDSWSKNQKEVHVVSAEGRYVWALDSVTNTIFPVRPSAISGYNRLQRIPINGKNYWADGWWGDSRCAFTMDRPEFSVLKNPTPDFLFGVDTISTNLHITLLSVDDGSARVKISYQHPNILSTETMQDQRMALLPPYPHPLREYSNGMVPFSVSQAGRVQLRLYDALGRLRRTLLDSEAPAGAQTLVLNTDGLSAGFYQLVLESAEGRITQALVITR